MTDSMSGRARLARNNINILGVAPTSHGIYVIYEFQYRLPNHAPVWRKTFGRYDHTRIEHIIENILDDVRALRRELENDESNSTAD